MPEEHDRRGCPYHGAIEVRVSRVEKDTDQIWTKIDGMTKSAYVAMGAVVLQLLIMLGEVIVK